MEDVEIASVLDGRYTFENFVVGTGNRLAYAAAKSVAQSPADSYNPLLIHGGSGLGKTHLLAAIGRRILLEKPVLEVRYVSAEMPGLSAAETGESTLESLKASLPRVDVLLVDDLQAAVARQEVQTALLEALEALQERRGQLVATSAWAPDELQALDERLLTRLRSGLVVDIQSPDVETRAAILRFKLRQAGAELPAEIVDELARRAPADVRELELALSRAVSARGSSRTPLTPERARELLQLALPPPPAGGNGPGNEFADFFENMAHTISAALEEAALVAGPELQAESLEPLPAPRPDYTLADWILGPANQLATECALRILGEPGSRFNPLFLYSATGMGKTHLLNAIGNAALETPASRVGYVTAEEFSEELSAAIREGRLARMRARYRTAELLLVDDVQVLAGRDRVQEDFFHLFEELTSRKRQIVLASDRAPRELAGFQERLVSRFEGGVVVEIAALDPQTAAASFLAFLRGEGFAVNEALASDLARRLAPTSVREIQGAAKRVALRAESSSAPKDAAYLRRAMLHDPRVPRAELRENVDPFFTDPAKVFLHWEPMTERLRERFAR